MTNTAYLALGSNMGDCKKNLAFAVEALSNIPGVKVEAVSGVFETKPWGYENQSNFFNSCVRISAEISPEALLGVCLGIEAGMGKVRQFLNGPRLIDIDVLLYNNEIRDTKELILPHPRMFERDFVLVPLLEVAKDDIKEKIENNLKNLREKYVL